MQINRLFEIVYILLEKKQVTAEELAKRFEVSTRTIYRDIEVLSASRIPIYMTRGKNGGISVLSDFTLDKTVLTQKEKSDIIASLKVIESVNITDDNTALNKLSAMLGDVNTDWIEINFSSWNNDNSQQETFSLLKKAILERKEVEFIYSSTKLEETKRTVKPLKLVYKGASWYLYGHCTLRDDYRFFKLRRLKNLIITNRRFFEETPKKYQI